MARQRSLFGFGPPFRFIADRLLQDPEFRSDLRQVVNLPEEKFRSLASALDAHPNFLVASDVAAIAQKEVAGTEAEPLARALLRLYLSLRTTQEPEEEALDGLCAAVIKHSADFPRDKIDDLKLRVQRLVLAPRGFKRQQKAEALAEATGADLNEVNIICDIRPVFDDQRKEIEGAVVISTLTLEITELDGTLSSVECCLTEKQLDDLCKVSLNAKQKLVAIKNLLASKSIPRAPVFEIAPAEEK
jgi:hypothetical protein